MLVGLRERPELLRCTWILSEGCEYEGQERRTLGEC